MKRLIYIFLMIAMIPLITGGGMIQKRPRAYSPTVAPPSGSGYTEVNPIIITPTGTEGFFNDYDIYTNNGIPKGAVVDLIVLNNSSTSTMAGARTDGSGITRLIDVDGYLSTGGSISLRFITTVHVTTGLIEIYAETNANITFMVVGYWEGITFTERFDSITVGSTEDDAWTSRNVNTLFSTPVSRVYDFMLVNNANASHILGVRSQAETSLERKVDTTNVYAGGYGGFNLFCLVDASGLFKVWLDAYNTDICYSMGYFDDTVDYQERFDDITPTVNGSWQDKDLTSYVSSPLQAEILMFTSLGGVSIGSCKDGTTTATRYFTEGTGGSVTTSTYSGIPFVCNLTTGEVVQVRSGDYTRAKFYHAGYFK